MRVALIVGTGLMLIGAVWSPAEGEKNGVRRVISPDSPRDGCVSLDLEELWRIGGDAESDEEFFGVISSVIADGEGNAYLLDRQLAEVKVFSAAGEYVRTIGREGEGPGEFRMPSEIFFTPDGNVGVLQSRPGKIVLLSPVGEPSGEFRLPELEGGGRRMLMGGRRAADRLVIFSSTMARRETGATRIATLASYNADGSEAARFHEQSNEINFASPEIDEREGIRLVWAAGADGRVYAVRTFGGYEIDVWAADGTLERVQGREYSHLKRTAEEIEEAKSRILFRGPMEPRIIVSEHEPDVGNLFPRPDGSLWVMTSRGMKEAPNGSLGVFDVFDSGGLFVRQVTLMGEGDPAEDAYFFIGDRIFVLTSFREAMASMFAGRSRGGTAEVDVDAVSDEAAPMEVICYRVPEG